MNELLSPPIAFLGYVILAYVLYSIGRKLAGPAQASADKSQTYSSGEVAPTRTAEPGYRPFFVVALFFAILHLGVLVIGSGEPNGAAAIYLVGLVLALVALILG